MEVRLQVRFQNLLCMFTRAILLLQMSFSDLVLQYQAFSVIFCSSNLKVTTVSVNIILESQWHWKSHLKTHLNTADK